MARKERSTVTIASVARLAGVSTATAGRVLGGYGYASDEVRERVHASAEHLGYRANLLARSLITGETKTIGVVAGDIQSPFYATILRAIEDVAREAGFGVLLTNSDERPEREIEAVQLLARKQVDGIIVAPSDIAQADHLRALVDAACPLVQIDRAVRGLDGDSVTVDNLNAARACTGVLIAAGHRRIGILAELERWEGGGLEDFLRAASAGTVVPDELFPSWQRLLGYVRAHQEAGLAIDPALVARVGVYSARAAEAAVGRLLDSAAGATAVFSTDGLMSCAVMAVMNRRGVAVPDDLSLICFDDLDWMGFLRPGISAVVQPMAEIGREAARLLLERIHAPDALAPRHLVLTPQLNLRGSVRPLAGG